MLKRGIADMHASFVTATASPVELIKQTIEHMNLPETERYNAFNYKATEENDKIMEQAEQSQKRYQQGKSLSKIDGIPISFKDNYLVKNMPATAGSKILSNFIPPIDSTIAKRCREAGAIIIGKTNMDEFGMGSFNFYSTKIPVNPIDKRLVVGGSSGGAAVAVKTGQGFAALATDTKPY